MSWDRDLTNEQREAVSHPGGHARLLAGPGTGKTLVLTRRVVYLIADRGVSPGDILVLTFTRAAAAELRKRIEDGLGPAAQGVVVSTLHSYALRTILRLGAGGRLPHPIRIADDWEERHIIEEDLKVLAKLDSVRRSRDLLNQLSADWERLDADAGAYRFPVPEFQGAWQEHRTVFGYTLRSELVYQLKHALEERAIHLSKHPRHILVDEYQDLNPCDLAVLKVMAEGGCELYVAGDDDQSIYGFRHANPEGIRRFDTDYSAASLDLKECQRCGSEILKLGDYVARQDPRRKPKQLAPAGNAPPGEVRILSFCDQREEAEGVARICRWLIDTNGLRPEDILILLRNDRDGVFSQPIREALERNRLPAGVVADPLRPLNEPYGRQLIGILRLVVDDQDSLAWRTLLQLARNGVGEKTLWESYELARARGQSFAASVMAVARDPSLIPVRGCKLASVAGCIQRVVADARAAFAAKPLADALDSVVDQRIPDPAARTEIAALLARAICFAPSEGLEDLLASLNVSLGDREQEQQGETINIMTMHQAKGLTATAVFIVAAEDEYIPGRAKGAEIDDERRLLYVSLTRAKRYLHVTHCQRRTHRQIHTGARPGSAQRALTRFLSGGPVQSEPGDACLRRLQ